MVSLLKSSDSNRERENNGGEADKCPFSGIGKLDMKSLWKNMHVENKTWLCFGKSCMQDLVPVCLLPCAILVICLFDHTNFLLGIFVLCIDIQRNSASKTSAAFHNLSCCCDLEAQVAYSMQMMFKLCSWSYKDFCVYLFSSKWIVLECFFWHTHACVYIKLVVFLCQYYRNTKVFSLKRHISATLSLSLFFLAKTWYSRRDNWMCRRDQSVAVQICQIL